jgi:hypothetical protein
VRIDLREITADHAEVGLCFEVGEPLRTSDVPGSAARAMRLLPGLRGHRCDNASGVTFADELADTELAHLFEHAALEIMALAGALDTLRGSTTWDFARDGAGVFSVSLEHDDEGRARGAIDLAGEVVEWVTGGGEEPLDVRAGVRRLRRATG